MIDICMYCAREYKKRDYRHKFCSVDCRNDYKREIIREERLLSDVDAKKRKFSDLTITLVAAAILRGENLQVIVRLCNWDKVRFYSQLSEHKNKIEARKKTILKRSIRYSKNLCS